METIRQKKIASLLQKKLSYLFNNNKLFNDILIIDINKVDISYNLELAKIYISFFPNIENKFLSKINIFYNKYYKKKLSKIIRYQIKKIPKIIFYLDNSLYNINFLEKELKREGENIIK